MRPLEIIGIFAFLWVFVEILNAKPSSIKRAKVAALLGVIFFFASWLVAGYLYVNFYGQNVKPLIKSGPNPAGHAVFMESKEHIFLFIPFLSFLALALLYQKDILENNETRKSLLLLSSLIILLGLAMAGMGYLISSSAREALEAARAVK